MSEKKKKEDKSDNGHKADIPLSQLLLDCNKDKYRMVTLTTRWAHEVKQRDAQSGLLAHDLVNIALKEILTGQVPLEEIEKLPPVPKVEKKAEPTLKLLTEAAVEKISDEDGKKSAEKAGADGKE